MNERQGGESLEDICAGYFGLAFPDADDGWVGERAASVAGLARQAMRAAHPPAAPRTHEDLTQALRQLNDHGLSARAGSVGVRHLDLTITAEAGVGANGRGELTLTVTGPGAGDAGTWLSLTAGRPDLRYLASVGGDGRAAFTGLPDADWTLDLVDDVPPTSAVIPLPVVRPLSRAAAAAPHDFVLVLPGGALFQVNRSGPSASYVLEIMAAPAGPLVYVIRYVSDGTPSDLLVPVTAHTPARRSRVMLPGFSGDGRWETTEPLSPAAVPPDDGLIARSIAAAVDRATLRAWHGLVPQLPPDTAEIVTTRLRRR
ncbi:hypothetical protein ABZ815_24910 [Nonomuraea sp. NPDC047529]|uniref:hypothetical protein n=1 Tax=Nonomuraea sp. NPDC047529 TaxID=3155623 RepID=UPI003410A8A7